MTISVHAFQPDETIYAVEIDDENKNIVSIFDTRENTFISVDEEFNQRIIDHLDKGLLPVMDYSQWLFKKKEDLITLKGEDFSAWLGQMKSYCARRRRYCEQKYPASPMYTFQTEIMRDLYPHWTWYLCEQIKEVRGYRLIMRNGRDYRRDNACDRAQWKWEELTEATAVE